MTGIDHWPRLRKSRQAARDATATEAGIAPAQWYAHVDGDSRDFVSIAPATTDAQDEKIDAILKGKKLTTGYKSALEFRTMTPRTPTPSLKDQPRPRWWRPASRAQRGQ